MNVGDPPARSGLGEVERHRSRLLFAGRCEMGRAGEVTGGGAVRDLQVDLGRRPVLGADERIEIEFANFVVLGRLRDVLRDQLGQ